jgi:hypothetical protein
MIGAIMKQQQTRRHLLHINLACALLTSVLLAPQAIAKSACAPAGSAEDQAVRAIHIMFEAARTDDMAKFNSVAEPEFYAYDGGKLFQGSALMGYIQQAHAAGKVFEWNVTEPKVHVSCDVAWITYINKGAVQDSSGRQDLTWLESAILDYRGGHWLIHFLHSTRAPAST